MPPLLPRSLPSLPSLAPFPRSLPFPSLAPAQSELASTMASLAKALARLPRTGTGASGAAEAEVLLRRALRLRESALGPVRGSRHPDLASLQLDLATLLEDQGVGACDGQTFKQRIASSLFLLLLSVCLSLSVI